MKRKKNGQSQMVTKKGVREDEFFFKESFMKRSW